jgi:YggT family protein
MNATLLLIADLVLRLAALLFLIRFLLQASKADFYNPISQFVVKGSDPLTRPLRALLPSLGSWDFASLLVGWIMCILFVVLITLGSLGISDYLILGLVRMLSVLIDFYFWSIIIVIIASFLSSGQYNPGLGLLQQLVEPLVAPIRRLLPDTGPLDFSPMIVSLILTILQRALSGGLG